MPSGPTSRRGSWSPSRSPTRPCARACARSPTTSCARSRRGPFRAVGVWYEDFTQTTDDEVRTLLEQARRPAAGPAARGGAAAARRGLGLRRPDRARDAGALRPHRRGVARHAGVLPRARGDHEAADRRGRLHRGGRRGGLAGRVPGEPLRARGERRRDGGGGARPTSGASRSGCGATSRWPSSSRCCASTTTRSRPRRRRSGSTGSTSTACTRRWRRWSSTWTASIPRRRSGPAHRYACFDQFGRDPQVYAYEAGIAGAEPCEQQAVQQLVELQAMARRIAGGNGHIDEDGHFFAEQNARLVVDAEEYYRAMFRGGVESWNLRDRHMAETLDELVAHLEAHERADEGRRVGAQLASRRRARDRAGAGRTAQPRPARAREARRTRRCSSASPRTREPSPPPPTGAGRRSASASAARSREAGRSCSTSASSTGSGSSPASCGAGGSSARSASSTGPRPSASRTTSTPASPTSSTPSSTSTRRTRSSPWSARSEWEAGELPETYPWGV